MILMENHFRWSRELSGWKVLALNLRLVSQALWTISNVLLVYLTTNYLTHTSHGYTHLPYPGKGAFGKQCSRNTNEWERQFSDLLKYRSTHGGDSKVPTKNTTLGRWVSSQRKKYRQFINDEGRDQDQAFGWSKELRNRFQRLKDIGFNFYVGKGNAQQRKSNLTETAK